MPTPNPEKRCENYDALIFDKTEQFYNCHNFVSYIVLDAGLTCDFLYGAETVQELCCSSCEDIFKLVEEKLNSPSPTKLPTPLPIPANDNGIILFL